MIGDERALLKSIVMQALPEDYMLLGDTTVMRLIDQRDTPTDPVHVAGGHDFDLGATISLITAAVGLANSFLKIYIDWKNSKSKPPSVAELVAAEGKSGVVRSAEVEQKRVAIATAVIQEASR
jgi:hypothetical protein